MEAVSVLAEQKHTWKCSPLREKVSCLCEQLVFVSAAAAAAPGLDHNIHNNAITRDV